MYLTEFDFKMIFSGFDLTKILRYDLNTEKLNTRIFYDSMVLPEGMFSKFVPKAEKNLKLDGMLPAFFVVTLCGKRAQDCTLLRTVDKIKLNLTYICGNIIFWDSKKGVHFVNLEGWKMVGMSTCHFAAQEESMYRFVNRLATDSLFARSFIVQR